MELEVGAFLAEIEPAVYVIDCLPNMQEPEVAERAEPLVRQLRAARPSTPIVLVEDRTYSNAHIYKSSRARHETSRAALTKAFDNLQSAGDGEGAIKKAQRGFTQVARRAERISRLAAVGSPSR